jgi:hypothetical protein
VFRERRQGAHHIIMDNVSLETLETIHGCLLKTS